MISSILTVGDSFTYGEELSDLNNAWPFKLGAKVGATVNNMAKPGSGNKRMIRYVMEEIAEGRIPDLVVIGWSSPGRMEFADEDGFFDIWPGYSGRMFMREQPWRLQLIEYINRHHNDEYIFKQYLLDIILLKSFLDQNKVKFVMLKTVGCDYYHFEQYHRDIELQQKLAPYVKDINNSYFVGWPATGMSEWTLNCPQGPNRHFLDEGHERVANTIYEHIRNLGWLS